jgi:carbonic anhydrase
VPAERPAEAAWSYEGGTGSEHWGDLAADYATGAAGEQQSPIDLKVDAAEQAPGEEVPDVAYGYQPATYELVDKVHTIQVEVEGEAGGITIGDERYKLVQFHAHAPSEHALDGERTDLEVHLVHQNDDSELAVVGVLIEGDGTGSEPARARPGHGVSCPRATRACRCRTSTPPRCCRRTAPCFATTAR